jgi:hypothetical protein
VRTALDHKWFSLGNLATARDGLLAARKRDLEEQRASLGDEEQEAMAVRPNHSHLPTSCHGTWGAIEAAIVAAAAATAAATVAAAAAAAAATVVAATTKAGAGQQPPPLRDGRATRTQGRWQDGG